jgi:3-oxoacyl-[acyl-carrier protein] reductase
MTKTAIITGGSSGIGHAAAVALARQGFDIGFTYNRGERRAREIQDEIRQTGRKA